MTFALRVECLHVCCVLIVCRNVRIRQHVLVNDNTMDDACNDVHRVVVTHSRQDNCITSNLRMCGVMYWAMMPQYVAMHAMMHAAARNAQCYHNILCMH